MFDRLSELADFLTSLPVGTVLDGALKADLLNRVQRIGKGEPQASGGSRYDELAARLTGDAGRYPAPAGPGGPPPPPPPPVVPEEPPTPEE